MAAALPYCDALLPGDTFRSLAMVIAQIAADTTGAGARWPVSSRGSRAPTVGTARR